MAGSEIIKHKNKEIVIVDLSKCDPEKTFGILKEAAVKISQFAPKSALILTDSTDAVYNGEVSSAIKEFSAGNTPYVKGSAVVGADAMRKILVSAVRMVTKRDIRTFDTREDAMEWLVSL